jgi:site-specific DNA-methyltransferase (adenine-specific)
VPVVVDQFMSTSTAQILTSSKDQRWRTPPELFEPLHRELQFGLDAAAQDGGVALVPYYITPEIDALAVHWPDYCEPGNPVAWLNPPYGRDLGEWIAKAHRMSLLGMTVVCLIHPRTDTAFWHEHVMFAAEVRCIKGRVTFLDPDTGRPAKRGSTGAHVLVIFRADHDGPPTMTSMVYR